MKITAGNTGLAKAAVLFSADIFVVNQSLVPRINICGEIPPPTQSPKTITTTLYQPCNLVPTTTIGNFLKYNSLKII